MKKTSRNQPCLCGSGKKFKHCCGALKRDITITAFDLPSSKPQDATTDKMALAQRYQNAGQLPQAEEIYRQILQSNPDFVEAHKNLGNVLRIQGKLREASISLQRVLARQPDDAATKVKLATLRPVIMESHPDILDSRQRFIDNVAELLQSEISLAEPNKETGVTNFYFAYHGFNDRELQIKLATLYEQACPALMYTAPHCVDLPVVNGKIKIGFVSKFLNNHTIGKVMAGIIANLSRAKFEVYVFFLPQHKDEMATFIQQHADHVVTLPLVLEAARHQIANKQLDILVYPDIGMDSFTYFLAFARLAPVQCTTWGHPVTSGIRNLDYFISSRDMESNGAEEHYSEKLIRLNSQLTFYYKPILPPLTKVRSHFGLEQQHIYLCPQALFKFHPDFDVVMADILKRDPQGEVVLVEATHEHWTELLKKRLWQTLPEVMERVRFVPRMNLGDYFNLIAVSDVLLDPFPFGGGNTSYEALAIGTPIVTLPSKFMRGRFAYACYRQMGVMDCVASSPANYVEIAVQLGTDSWYREQIKAKILAANNLLYEDVKVVREWEQFFMAGM